MTFQNVTVETFDAPATALDLHLAAAQALAAEFGDDLTEWLV